MNTVIRNLAVSGSAAVALLGSAAAGATAADEHTPATVLAAYRTDANDPAGVTTGVVPDDNSGTSLQNPLNTPTGVTPAGTNDQIVTQASGGTIAVGAVAILILGGIVIVRVKHRDIKPGDAVILTLFGIAVSGTVIGTTGNQVTTSLVGSLSGVLGGL